jgi:hypothetical protein
MYAGTEKTLGLGRLDAYLVLSDRWMWGAAASNCTSAIIATTSFVLSSASTGAWEAVDDLEPSSTPSALPTSVDPAAPGSGGVISRMLCDGDCMFTTT